MWLLRESAIYFTWLKSIFGKIRNICLISMLSSILLLMVSNIFTLIALFLPLKVIFLLGADEVPAYLSSVWAEDREFWVISLSVLSVGFYLLANLLTYLSNRLVSHCASNLRKGASEISIYENQEKMAVQYMGRVCNFGASSTFVVLSAFAGIYIKCTLFASLLGLLVLFVGFLAVALNREVVRERVGNSLSSFFSFASGFGFLLFFAIMLMDFYSTKTFDVVENLLSLLLARQLLQKFQSGIVESIVLSREKDRVDSLFFTRSKVVNKNEDALWGRLLGSKGKDWVSAVQRSISSESKSFLNMIWRQIGIKNVALIELCQASKQNSDDAEVIKVYSPIIKASAVHEIALLKKSWSHELPAPRLVGSSLKDSCFCLGLRDVKGTKVELAEVRDSVNDVISQSWSVRPRGDLVAQYFSAKKGIYDRVEELEMDKLDLVSCSQKEAEMLAVFRGELKNICSILRALPIFVYNPDLHSESIRRVNGRVVALHWGRWSLEPIGAGILMLEEEISKISSHLNVARRGRSELENVSVNEVKLSAFMIAFERYFNFHYFRSAFDLIPDILGCLENGGEEGEVRWGQL